MTASMKASTTVDDQLSRLRAIANIEPAGRPGRGVGVDRTPGHRTTRSRRRGRLGAAVCRGHTGRGGRADAGHAGRLDHTPDADLDRAGRAIYVAARTTTERLGLMPWLGKKFDQAAQRGTNSVTGTAVVLAKLLAPTYRMRRAGDHWEGFDMLNRVEDSVVLRRHPGSGAGLRDHWAPIRGRSTGCVTRRYRSCPAFTWAPNSGTRKTDTANWPTGRPNHRSTA